MTVARIRKESVEPFVDSTPLLHDSYALRARLDMQGYLFLRNILPKSLLETLRSQILKILAKSDWLHRDCPTDSGIANLNAFCVEPQPQFCRVYKKIYKLELFHSIPHHPDILRIFQGLLGEDILLHPKITGRIIFPSQESCPSFTTPPHQDHLHIQGTECTYTLWFPLHHCSTFMGSLILSPRSHQLGLQKIQPAYGEGGLAIKDYSNLKWVSGDISFGDAIVFHSLTTHASFPNTSERIRLSIDCRYQRISNLVCKPSLDVGAIGIDSWDEVYSNWKSEGLTYYWRDYALNIAKYNAEFQNKRDDDALKMAKAGDRNAISALHRISAHNADPEKQKEATRLISMLESSKRN